MNRNPHLYLRGRAPKPELHRLAGVPLRYPFVPGAVWVDEGSPTAV